MKPHDLGNVANGVIVNTGGPSQPARDRGRALAEEVCPKAGYIYPD